MDNINTIRSKIELIDEEIARKYSDELRMRQSRIDFTKEDWVGDMRAIETEYRKIIEPELAFIRQTIVELLAAGEFKDLGAITSLLENTHQLKSYIAPTFGELEENIQRGSDQYVTLSLLLFMGRNLEPDARDEMQYFQDLTDFFRSKKIDIKPIVENLLPYASEEIKFDSYSIKWILQHFLAQSTLR
jgi:hypothetical protein